jgi:undecaprenyl diphosphate synthase
MKSGTHAAIIMDGNGRWAQARGLPRTFGHREGAKAVRRVVEAAPDLGITTLTLYAFSSDNWVRPKPEVAALMRLFHRHLRTETAEMVEKGVRLSLVGRRDRLPKKLVQAAAATEEATREGARLHLRLAIDYSARDLLVRTAETLANDHIVRGIENPPTWTREEFAEMLGRVMHQENPAGDVDVLIRSSGEKRLSDFLLWECAYAELVFTDTLWPDFGGDHLAAAMREFRGRDRRYGAVSSSAAAG